MPTLSGPLASILVAACLLAGCIPAVPTPTPVPTYRCTPEAGGAEFDCGQKQHDDMVAKDQLYAEAEAVYRKFFEEDVRIYKAGGVDQPTPVLLATAHGTFVEDSMDLYRGLIADSRRLKGDVRLVSLLRRPGIAKESSVAVLAACTDARDAKVLEHGKEVGQGFLIEELIYFGRFNGSLKIQGADGEQEGRCAGS